MIQRIQSIYLLLVIVLVILTAIFPVVEFVNTISHYHYLFRFGGIYCVKPSGIIELYDTTWILVSLLLVIAFISGVTIFSFKKRAKQIRLVNINSVFIIIYYVLLFSFIFSTVKELKAEWNLQFSSLLPLIALILNFLSLKAIVKDDKLVKSLNRIR